MANRNKMLLGGFTSFLLLTMIIVVDFADAQTVSVTVATDKFQYLYRDLVHVYGNVTHDGNPVNDGLVAIDVTDPTSKHIMARTVPANKTPSVSWELEISSLYSCDWTRTPKTIFAKSETVYFDVAVTNNVYYSRDALIVVNVYDFDSTPVGIRSVQTSIPAHGGVSLLVDMKFDTWVSEGNATVFASVWTDWPANLGYPHCPEKNASFAISRTAVPAPIGGESGSYNAVFRLHPESPLGDYHVRVGAFSGGSTAIGSTGFVMEYQERGDVIYDRKIDIFDVVMVTSSYDSRSGSPIWNPQVDLKLDGTVDIFDVTTVTSKYEMSY